MARAPRDLVVRFMSDVAGFLKGTDQIQDAFHAVGKAQDQLGADSDANAADLARAYERAGDKIDRDTREKAKRNGATMKESGREIGREFVSNLGEAISNGKGDLADTFLGTAGGLASSLGIVGAVAGVGIFIVQGISAEASKQAKLMQTAGNDLFESLRKGMLDTSDREGILMKALGVDNMGDAMTELTKQADKLGVKSSDLYQYLMSAGRVASPQLAESLKHAGDYLDTSVNAAGLLASGPLNDAYAASKKIKDELRFTNGAIDAANVKYAPLLELQQAGATATAKQAQQAQAYLDTLAAQDRQLRATARYLQSEQAAGLVKAYTAAYARNPGKYTTGKTTP